jgi:hypothetical protein
VNEQFEHLHVGRGWLVINHSSCLSYGILTTSLDSLDNIPAAYKDVIQNVAEVGDKWLDLSLRRLGDGNDVEGEFVMMKEDSSELGCHIGRGHLKVLAKGSAVAAGKEENHCISVCILGGIAFVEEQDFTEGIECLKKEELFLLFNMFDFEINGGKHCIFLGFFIGKHSCVSISDKALKLSSLLNFSPQTIFL